MMIATRTPIFYELLYYHFAGPSTWGGETECTNDLVQPRLCELHTGLVMLIFDMPLIVGSAVCIRKVVLVSWFLDY